MGAHRVSGGFVFDDNVTAAVRVGIGVRFRDYHGVSHTSAYVPLRFDLSAGIWLPFWFSALWRIPFDGGGVDYLVLGGLRIDFFL